MNQELRNKILKLDINILKEVKITNKLLGDNLLSSRKYEALHLIKFRLIIIFIKFLTSLKKKVKTQFLRQIF